MADLIAKSSCLKNYLTTLQSTLKETTEHMMNKCERIIALEASLHDARTNKDEVPSIRFF